MQAAPAGRSFWASRVSSFRCAFAGIGHLVRTQRNCRLHLAATVIVLSFGGWLGVDRVEWCLLALAIGLVWTAEALNTAVEYFVDEYSPALHPAAGHAKDVGAAAVLLASFAAAAVGLLVFVPKLLLLQN